MNVFFNFNQKNDSNVAVCYGIELLLDDVYVSDTNNEYLARSLLPDLIA